MFRCILVLVVALSLGEAQRADCGCKCSQLTLTYRGQVSGNCKSSWQGARWCYVDSRSAPCGDLKNSTRSSKPWSHKACRNKSSRVCRRQQRRPPVSRPPVSRPPVSKPRTDLDDELIDGTCYEDNNSRLLDDFHDSATNTPDECIRTCASRGYSYAGVQYTTQCFCGNDEPPASRIRDSSQCDAQCPGDASLSCGGTWRMNIYTTVKTAGLATAVGDSCSIDPKMADCTYTCTDAQCGKEKGLCQLWLNTCCCSNFCNACTGKPCNNGAKCGTPSPVLFDRSQIRP